MNAEIEQLRKNIRKLHPSGVDGFEGLLAVVLTDITKVGFNLAKSGSQRGKDGAAIYDPGSITFEAKRYDDTVPKNEVLSKIGEIVADDTGFTDLWILGATSPVASQDNATITTLGKKSGIGTLILDWSETSLPALATLLAMAKEQSISFIADKTKVPEAEIRRGMDAVQAHLQYDDLRRTLTEELNQPSIGPAYAQKRNGEYLRAAFANRSRARAVFGQALSPGDGTLPGILDRKDLRETLARAIFPKPNEKIAAILGSDGNGKSWLFGQCWLNQTPKPLTVIIVPNEIKEPFALSDVEPLLISRLIAQTGDSDIDATRQRWRRHFARWLRTEPGTQSRVVVLLDGLNQRESIYWGNVVNAFSQSLSDLGGKLVISARTPFFNSHLKGKVVDPFETIDVPEWSTPELEALLAERGSSVTKLKPQVADSLRNPRVFAVAAELFQAGRIEGFDELSVSRLLFEHIRVGASPEAEQMPVGDFVSAVRAHADEVVKRLQAPDPIDTTIFTRKVGPGGSALTIEDQFKVTSAGRFFEEVLGEPTLYSVKDEGLPLGLGLSVLGSALRAYRNKKPIGDQLAKILDPITALDKTAEVLLAAVIAAVLSDDIPNEVVAALVTAYVTLQNLGGDRYPEFRALSKDKPEAFLLALEDATLSEGVTSNLDWLKQAVQETRDDPKVWAAIAQTAKRWLSMYSPSPERMIIGHKAGSDKWRQEYDKRKQEIDDKSAKMSASERAIMADLILESRGNYNELNEIAIEFLAGKALKDFGEAFRNWCFAASFNGGIWDAKDNFYHLVQLNRADWTATRDALLAASQSLRAKDISETGRWALVYALRATADNAAAKDATAIVEDLTKDRERRPGWRLIEDWCATDPCDPASARPENIAPTADRYRKLDVARLRTSLSQGQDDHFFEDARVGLARFEPEAAADTMRRFAAQLVTRSTPDFRIGAFLLENHTAALEDSAALDFLGKASAIGEEMLAGSDPHKESFIASQYAMMIAFPHLTGDQQLAALVTYSKIDNILLATCDLMQDADGVEFEHALEKAYAAGDSVVLFRLMAFAEYTGTLMSPRARAIIGELAHSTTPLVRLCALGAVLRLKDTFLAKQIANDGWTANGLDPSKHRFEIWYGSQLLVLAAANGSLPIGDCIDRVTLDAFLELIRKVGKDAAVAVAQRIEIALKVASNHTIRHALPYIGQRMDEGTRPNCYNVDDRPDPNETTADSFRRMAETDAAFYERHERNQEAVAQFERDLTAAGAHLILDAVTPELLEALYREVPQNVKDWHASFIALDDTKLRAVHNIAMPVAQAIAADNPDKAVTMFERLSRVDPFIHLTFDNAEISLDSVALWKAGDSLAIRELRYRRMDHAATDQAIALEVLAAERAGKADQLRDYVLDRRARPEPVYVARALMVAGLSSEAQWAIETIEAHKDDAGFLSYAYDAAKYAMDRHRWSKHWAEMMRDAHTAIELWRYAVILGKIVDGRFKGREVEHGSNSGLVERYGPTFNNLIKSRIKKWKDKREKTLFGQKVPGALFLR